MVLICLEVFLRLFSDFKIIFVVVIFCFFSFFFKQEKYNIYEKAIYAALSGNLNALLPVSRSWGDYVWAYFRTYVDQMVEQEVHFLSQRKKEELPPNYLNKR